MKKLLTLAICVAIVCTALCSCKVNVTFGDSTEPSAEEQTTIAEQTAAPAEETTAAEEEATTKAPETSDKGDIFSWQLKVNGVDFKVPFDASELSKIGFSIKEKGKLKANTYSIGIYGKNSENKSLHLQLWNPTNEAKNYADCKVGQLSFDAGDDFDVILPGGLKFDSTVTVKKIKSMYGEPDDTSDGDGYKVLYYRKDIYQKVEFFIYDDSKKAMKPYSSVTMQNFV